MDLPTIRFPWCVLMVACTGGFNGGMSVCWGSSQADLMAGEVRAEGALCVSCASCLVWKPLSSCCQSQFNRPWNPPSPRLPTPLKTAPPAGPVKCERPQPNNHSHSKLHPQIITSPLAGPPVDPDDDPFDGDGAGSLAIWDGQAFVYNQVSLVYNQVSLALMPGPGAWPWWMECLGQSYTISHLALLLCSLIPYETYHKLNKKNR